MQEPGAGNRKLIRLRAFEIDASDATTPGGPAGAMGEGQAAMPERRNDGEGRRTTSLVMPECVECVDGVAPLQRESACIAEDWIEEDIA